MAARSSFATPYIRSAFALLGVTALVALWWGSRDRILSGSNDFVALYAGSHLAGSRDLYNERRMVEVEHETTGVGGETLQFIRPPYYALLLQPLSYLPYRLAYPLWQLLSMAAVVTFICLWRWTARWPAIWACSWSLPLSTCFAQGQDCAFLLVWIALVLRFYQQRPFLAGLVFSLCAAKFHLFLPVPILIAGQRRWRLASGFLAGAAGLMVLSFLSSGLTWPADYLRMVGSNKVSPGANIMPNLHGLLEGAPHAGLLEIVLGILIAVAVAAVARRSSFEQALAATLVGGLLVSNHAYPADGVILIPALLLILFGTQNAGLRTAALVLLTPIAWIGCIVGGAPMTLLRLSLVALAGALVFQAYRRDGKTLHSATL